MSNNTNNKKDSVVISDREKRRDQMSKEFMKLSRSNTQLKFIDKRRENNISEYINNNNNNN